MHNKDTQKDKREKDWKPMQTVHT